MANEFHSEAININSSDISESVAEAMYSDAGLMAEEFHSKAMSQIVVEENHSHSQFVVDAGLMADEFHSEAININRSDMSEIVVDENHSHAENVVEQKQPC